MNEKQKIKKEHKNLINQIKKHNKYYFDKDNPIISDSQYDKLKRKLVDLE